MYIDSFLALSGSISGNTVTGQDVHATGATVKSTNVVDLGVARDIGEGENLYGRVEVTVAGAAGTSVEFQFVVADDSALTTNPVVIGTTGAIATAALTLGARFACRLNPQLGSLGHRYLGMQAVNVGAMTGITVYADVGEGIQDGAKNYAVGSAIL